MKLYFVNVIVSLLFITVNSADRTIYICDRKASCGCSPDAAVLGRIIGGEQVLSNSWGWVVGLYRSNSYFCSGSLIEPDLIITAGHCMIPELTTLSQVTVIAGTNTLSNTDGRGQVRQVKELFLHPDYDNTLRLNDIAIIRLRNPFNMLGSGVTVICLPNAVTAESIAKLEYPVPGTTLIVIGWGVTDLYDSNPSTTLQQVTVQAVASTSTDCATSTHEMVNSTIQFCAGVPGGGKDACQGDSGGPIMAFVANRWQLMGITSDGYKCALPGHSGIYTRIAYYIPFIDSIKNTNQTIIPTATAAPPNSGHRSQVTFREHIIFILLFALFNIL